MTIQDQHQAPILKNASNAPKKGTKEEIESPTKRMTPMNQGKEIRERSTSPTMKTLKGTPHPRALTPHWRIVTAPATKGCTPRPLSTTMRG
jgi:hypothetical protein